ncbi:MAG: hypothetical protein ACKVJA_05305 [Flavobacteriales bacterium]
MKKLLLILLCLPLVVCASFPVLEDKTNFNNDSCDNIILKNGKEISAKVIEITPELIKYKKCSNLDGPLISIYKNEVLMLRYSNGSKEIFSLAQESPYQEKKFGWGSIVSAICAHIAVVLLILVPFQIVFVLFFSFSAILFGTSSWAKRLWGFGLAGTIVGSLITLLVLLL